MIINKLWLRTPDLWCWKWPRYQLCQNHCPEKYYIKIMLIPHDQGFTNTILSFKKQTIGPELELSNWHNILNQSIRFWNLRLQYLLETLAKADDAMCESELCVGGSLESFYSLYYGSHSVPFDNNKQLTNVKRKPLNYLFQKPKSLPRLCSVLWQTPSNKAQPEAWPAVTQTFSDDKGRLVIRSYSIIGWF